MGSLTPIEYDRTPDKNFYLCRSCQTHIALVEDFVFKDIFLDAGIFEKAVNLLIDDPAHHQRIAGNRTQADVSCTRCNMNLGWKFVQVERPNLVVREGRYLILLNKLLFWNGHQLVDANTMEPTENT